MCPEHQNIILTLCSKKNWQTYHLKNQINLKEKNWSEACSKIWFIPHRKHDVFWLQNLTLFKEIIVVEFENITKQMSVVSEIMQTSNMKRGDAYGSNW
jgi:hypothetical protein